MRNQFRLRLALALGTCFALIGSDALAIDPGACCAQSTSRLETLLNPNKGSDEKFFTTAGGAPNVLVIVDTSGSMKDWPRPWPTSKGCNTTNAASDPSLHPDFIGYDSSKAYPGLYTGITAQTNATEDGDWFNRTKFYTIPNDHFGNNFASNGAPVNTTISGTAATACNPASPVISATDQAECVSCLATDGHYVYDSNYRVATGNFLNFYSPRDYAAISALSHLLFDVREVRLAIMTLTDYVTNGKCFAGAGQTGSSCACLMEPFGPSCDKSFPLDQSAVQNNRNSIFNSLAKQGIWGNCGTPLADVLYAAGHYFRSLPPADGFLAAGLPTTYPTDSDLNEKTSQGQTSVCSACGFNAIVLITDGEPTSEQLSIPAAMTGTAIGAPTCTGAYCGSKTDEVARFLWNTDLRADFSGKQKVATYTLGIALGTDATAFLKSVAKVGGGLYYPANRASEIEKVFREILENIVSRNNSFSSAAVATVQTGSSSTPALLPRMLPKSAQPWEGKLWRFEQYNEFVETTGSTMADLNGDGDNEDVFIVDSATPTVANIVTEASDGTFVRNNTNVAATPFWEANAKLVTDLAVSVNNRKVWTVLDTNGDGAFTSADVPVTGLTRLQPTNDAFDLKIAEYMGLVGSPYCPSATGLGSLLPKFGMTLAQAETAVGALGGTAEANYARLCAKLVMKWVQGSDLYDEDADLDRTEVRASVLGDIFHAAPVIVDAPVDTFLCELGLSNQCVRTLYSQALGITATPTPSESTTLAGNGACINASKPAYDAYVWDQRRRDKVVLVGANDGMVHAFLSGRFTGTEPCEGGQPLPQFNKGTGEELWAFLPPDLLPKLPDLILSHEYMVDGDIMVRDIWADEATFGSKQKSEFHTMAVVAEGRGGKHYLGLEMQYDANGTAKDQPGFRWMFPQPCSEEAATFGKTLFALSPKPPPIGPMLINNASLPTSIGGAIPRYGANTHERWMVAVSGGWSPGGEKGRGVYLLDVWNGAVNGRRDNLWWKFEYDEDASGSNSAPRKELTNSVAAPIALVDYGPDDQPGQDGFFDTAVFTDTAGQIWVGRMQTPGTVSTSDNKNRITNWYAGRAFEMDRDGVPGAATGSLLPDGGIEPVDTNAKSVANKWPFFYLPSVAVEPATDRVRVFAGTGNRYAILEQGPGMCRFDNPLGCSKANSDDVNVHYKYKDGVVDVGDAHTHWKTRRFEHGKLDLSLNKDPTETLDFDDTCGSNGNKRVEAENSEFKVGTCDVTGNTDPNPGKVNEVKYECGLNSNGSSFSCTRTGMTRNLEDLLDPSLIVTTGLGNNRFVGIWAYGGLQVDAGYRGFSGATGITPQQYDSARVSDRSTANPGRGELYDVTNVGCTAASCDGGAPEDSYGWFYTYSGLARKTATGGAVIASCVLWSDLSPSGGDGGLCGSTITPSSSIYQADFLTGQPNCAFGFLPTDGGAYARSQTRTVVAPPPEPASVVQVSKSGQVRYSAMIVEPGQGQATTVNVSTGQDVLQLVYELPVSRSLHNCRHAGTAGAGCSTVP